MEPLLKQLRELPRRLAGLPKAARYALGVGLAFIVVIAVLVGLLQKGASYEYAFTNLTAEDSSEAATVLKAADIPFRLEAGGSALAVPEDQVHAARLMLAAAGLPRGGGVGFEIFDRGDLGVSEFTQKVNLRRAIEGELARTISQLSPVRSARVHITLPEKGLYRNEERKATAAVVLNLQPGREIQERELAGIRHLVSSAVAGLHPGAVAIVDGRGTVLVGDDSDGVKLVGEQRKLETSMENRIIDLLEPVVGRGQVIAKVTAALDMREMHSKQDAYDPESATLRSERSVIETNASSTENGAGVAGAAANQPLNPAPAAGGRGSGSQSNREDLLKNYEVSKTTTETVARVPRLEKLSVAVLLADPEGKPRPEADLRRLGELAKHAVGFDADRGDRFDISSAPFALEQEAEAKPGPLWAQPRMIKLGAGALAVLVLLAVAAVFLLKRRKRPTRLGLLRPGAKVGEIEAAIKQGELQAAEGVAAAALPEVEKIDVQARARELTQADPARAAHLLRAWIAMDIEAREAANG